MQAPQLQAPETEKTPPPLDFLTHDMIHPDNRAVIENEQHRWRLLSWWERLKLQSYAGGLARQLRRGRYNPLVKELHQLRADFKQAKAQYDSTTFISNQVKREARQQLVVLSQRGHQVVAALKDLQPTYASYKHYQGWLDFEAKHRDELRTEAKREAKIDREMRREAKWLQQLIIDVWRKTDKCHYHYTDNGKEKTRTPKIERSVIRPDAHYFYVAASRRTLLGWRWLLPYGVEIGRLEEDEVIQNLCAATKRQVRPVWSDSGQLMIVVSRLDSPDALPREVKWRDGMKYFPEPKRAKLPYTIGVSESRKFQWFDLASDPHVLVAGKSQSGKSNLVNGIIGTLASTHSPDELRIVLVDQKGGIEFSHWYELPHLLWDIVKTVDQVEPNLNRLVSVMRHRMATLEKVKAKDIAAYNARVDAEHQLARVLVVIDEMNTFVGLGQQTEDIHNLIMLLVSQGRAVGVHVICATQHPEVKVIPGRIKTNMAVRLCGAMPNDSASMIVIDSTDAAHLPNMPGRFVAVSGLKTIVVQVPHIFDEDIAGVVSSTRQEYPDVAEELNEMKSQPKLVVWDEQRVLVSCLDWFEGQLSYRKLHKSLGSESPGERELSRLARRLIDEVEASGYVERVDNHTRWSLIRRKQAYHLVPKVDNVDKEAITLSGEPLSTFPPTLETASHESAAD